jgi:hypothetical protein
MIFLALPSACQTGCLCDRNCVPGNSSKEFMSVNFQSTHTGGKKIGHQGTRAPRNAKVVYCNMKKILTVLIVIVFCGCGGRLTDEQRKKMHEAAEQQAIVKISDAEITDAAFEKGRLASENLTQTTADSLAKALEVEIHWLPAGSKANSLAVEQQLMDAYLNSVVTGTPIRDNVQNVGQDSVLYTKVVVFTHPDSTIEIKGTWNIWMSKKQLVLGMRKTN